MLGQHLNYSKKIDHLRGKLSSENRLVALGALDIALKTHVNMRKDGKTPEIAHPIAIASYVSTLPLRGHAMEMAIAISLLHDIPEDYGVSDTILARDMMEVAGVERYEDCLYVAQSAWVMSKYSREGQKLSTKEYFHNIRQDAILTIVKAADGYSNIIDAPTATHKEKIELNDWVEKYCRYIEKYHLKALKVVRQATDNEDIRLSCEALKFGLLSIIDLTRKLVETNKSTFPVLDI